MPRPTSKQSADDRFFAPPPPPELRRAMDEGRVVPFIGAGISMGAKTDKGERMPSYKQLLQELVSLLDKNFVCENSWRREECLSLIHKGMFLEAADILDNEIPENSRFKYLRQILNPLRPKPSLAHELLNILNFKVVLTSNYDRILESTFFPRPEVITHEDSESIKYLSDDGKPFIFKIHGDLTRPKSIVLGWSKYRSLFDDPRYEALRIFFQDLLFRHTLLFLGCSLQGTEYSEYFFNFARAFRTPPGPHYALVEKGSVSAERKRIWEKELGVQFREYRPDPDYSQVWEFIASLKPRTIKRPKSGDPWENFYLAEERPAYLSMQLQREQKSCSCRYITPKLTNAIATEEYVARHCQDELSKFREKVPESEFQGFARKTTDTMLKRSSNIVQLLARGVEVRLVFLAETITEEIGRLGHIAIERYRHALSLADRYPEYLHMRAYSLPISREDFMKCSFALVFGHEKKSDVAAFYAPQASSNKFSTHIVQINTPYVTDRIETFERFWATSLSEQETLALLRKHV